MSDSFFFPNPILFLGCMGFVILILGLSVLFALRRFGRTLSNTAASNLWPLVAVSHQMTVRDAV